MSVSSSSSKESSSSSLESARARTASRLSTGAAHGRSATRDTARAGAHFRPTCWRPTLCLAATVALGARREVAIAPTSRGFGDARVTHEGRCDSGANPRTSAGWASRSARRLRPAASLLRSLGNKGRLTDPFSTSPLDGSTNPGFCCLCALPARFIFSKAGSILLGAPAKRTRPLRDLGLLRCGASGEMKSSTRASRSQKRKAQDAGIESSKADSPAPGSAEVRRSPSAPEKSRRVPSTQPLLFERASRGCDNEAMSAILFLALI